ncbi:hypothetical protein C8Q80DRAFT_895671 [Daedaleopsis nitida]|nr:hypothetical protein C8Q80DRAFT_895671 [Daedaleopsis nitida]
MLTHLSVYPGNAIWEFPVRSFFGLQELEIIKPKNLGGLKLVSHHCSALRSLALCGVQVEISSQLIPLLSASATALPDLTALKIICDPGSLESEPPLELISAVSTFLANKQRLRMPDLVLRTPACDEPDWPMWASLPPLPNLEVLSIDVHSYHWSVSEIRRLSSCIPLRLSALLIHARAMFPAVDEQARERHPPEWISLIRKSTSLKYLHILENSGKLNLKQRRRADHPDALQLFGYGPYLHWILRDAQADSAAGRHADDAPAGP